MAQAQKSSRSEPRQRVLISRVKKIPRLPQRPRDGHKGTFGRVLIIGGSRGMIGAPALSAMAALRSGAGLVTIACPRSIQQSVAVLCPCATTIPLPETRDGLIDPGASIRLFKKDGLFSSPPNAVAAGPGLGQSNVAWARKWTDLLAAFGERGMPVVLDADGLNAVSLAYPADHDGLCWPLPARAIITPHPGEMGRLMGISTQAVQSARESTAVRAARRMAEGLRHAATSQQKPDREDSAALPVVVLKGAGTLVTNGRHVYTNATGNPGMATGGTGDVLTGVIAALIAQGLPLFDAAVLGAHVHGLAGDMAVADTGEISLTAEDVSATLSPAFRQIAKRRQHRP